MLSVLIFCSQARGKYLLPGYKVMLYGGLGASMYMMGRMTLVGNTGRKFVRSLANDDLGTQDLVLKESRHGMMSMSEAGLPRGLPDSLTVPITSLSRVHDQVSFCSSS